MNNINFFTVIFHLSYLFFCGCANQTNDGGCLEVKVRQQEERKRRWKRKEITYLTRYGLSYRHYTVLPAVRSLVPGKQALCGKQARKSPFDL